MKAIAVLLVALALAGCRSDKPDVPRYDTPYPIPELIDPVSEQPVRTR